MILKLTLRKGGRPGRSVTVASAYRYRPDSTRPILRSETNDLRSASRTGSESPPVQPLGYDQSAGPPWRPSSFAFRLGIQRPLPDPRRETALGRILTGLFARRDAGYE